MVTIFMSFINTVTMAFEDTPDACCRLCSYLPSTDKYIYLDEGLSEITVNKEPLNTPMLISKGNSQLSIEDLLTGVTTEGFHTGSSVLVMMPN